MNWCYWCEAEIKNSQSDVCDLCVEGYFRKTKASGLWKELFG